MNFKNSQIHIRFFQRASQVYLICNVVGPSMSLLLFNLIFFILRLCFSNDFGVVYVNSHAQSKFFLVREGTNVLARFLCQLFPLQIIFLATVQPEGHHGSPIDGEPQDSQSGPNHWVFVAGEFQTKFWGIRFLVIVTVEGASAIFYMSVCGHRFTRTSNYNSKF